MGLFGPRPREMATIGMVGRTNLFRWMAWRQPPAEGLEVDPGELVGGIRRLVLLGAAELATPQHGLRHSHRPS
jgi:hypothetical protein